MWRLDDIGVFVAVVEQGSFVRAASYLDMPTSTVSRRISELEAALEIQLLERTSRKICVTERGQQLFEQCVPLVKKIRQEVATQTKTRNQLSGTICITAPVHLGNAILAPWLCAFLKQQQDIELDLRLSNRMEDLIDQSIDLAIRIGPLKDSQFIAQYLFTSHYGLYASNTYLQKHPLITSPNDLQQHDVATMAHQHSCLTMIDAQGREQSIATTTRMKCHDIEMALQVAVNGLGIACVPRLSVHTFQRQHELVGVLDEYAINPGRDVYAVYPSKKHLSAKTRLLIDFIRAEAAQVA